MKVIGKAIQQNFNNSFLSCEKNQELIWRKLFVDSGKHSDRLKRLLYLDVPNCLDETQYQYQEIIDKLSVQDLRKGQYIRAIPKVALGEHEPVKSYIILEFDDFLPSINKEFRSCIISFTIVCHLEFWELDDYKLRPHQIAGYIDGLLNHSRLMGIGKLEFMGASQIVLNEYFGGLNLRYMTYDGEEDNEHTDPKLPVPNDL